MTTRRQIHSYLAHRDRRLKSVLKEVGVFQMPPRRSAYLFLIEAISSQQLSIKAAETIHGRLLDLFPRRQPTPARLAQASVARLRSAGVSRQKAGYLRSIARFALRNDLSGRRLNRMSDQDVLELLTQIKGVGRWTAEVLLMFNLRRPDIFPVDDLGIRQTMKRLYHLRTDGRALENRLFRIADVWRPYRTHACIALWQWKDGNK
jgi:DNA-3-methyladenine glycosylase II